MPLFICSKCGCIENNHLVNKSETYIPTVYNYVGDEFKFFPHMSQMEMDGYDKEDIIVNGNVWKRKDEKKFLCSECNTGVHHNEFAKSFPSESTKILSLFSSCGFITPYDQDEISYIRNDDNEECGYEPNLQYYYILKLYRKMINDQTFKGSIIDDLKRRNKELIPSTETFKDYLKYTNFILFLDMMKEEGDNFHVTLQGDSEVDDWSDTREVSLHLLDSVIDESKAKGLWKTLWSYHNQDDDILRQEIFKYKYLKPRTSHSISNIGIDIFNNAFSQVHQMSLKDFNRKPYWKDIQSVDEKNEKLRKAEEKRQRKLNRSK